LPEVDGAGSTIEPMPDPELPETARAAESQSGTEAGASYLVDEVDRARAQEYALLSTLLSRSPDGPMIARLARLRGDATPLGVAHRALATAASHASAEGVEREYFDLFLGLKPGGLFPYASYYLTGTVQGRPLARLREALQRLSIERTPGQAEPEDHAATLLEIMSCLAGGQIAAPTGADREIFEQHLAPWIGRFFADMERAEFADFYANVGALGRTFIEIETEAFQLPP
jgi:TorA maturation chaperone TorD